MFLRPAALGIAMMVVATGAVPAATGADQGRVARAAEVATRRLDEWIGGTGRPDAAFPVQHAWWSSPAAMDLESTVAFDLARARFDRVRGAERLVNGIAWHLQSRIVEELFDYSQAQPGHHAADVPLFGGHVRWVLPTLILSRQGRDRRAPEAVRHAADAVATLEGVVGWPALAAALRVVAADSRPSLDAAAVRAILETALAIPLDWFFAALDATSPINYALDAVTVEPRQCPSGPCQQTTMQLRRQGQLRMPTGVDIAIELGSAQRSLVTWRDDEREKALVVESGLPPTAITIDPDRRIQLDDNPLDQRWRSTINARRPIKSFAAWVVWLQNAVLTYGALV